MIQGHLKPLHYYATLSEKKRSGKLTQLRKLENKMIEVNANQGVMAIKAILLSSPIKGQSIRLDLNF